MTAGVDFSVAADNLLALVRAGRLAQAHALFVQVLTDLQRGSGSRETAGDPSSHARACTHFAKAWGELVVNDAWAFSGDSLREILFRLYILHAIVQGSAVGTLDEYLLQLNARRQGRHDVRSLVRMLLLWVPDSRAGFSPFGQFAASPHLVVAQALATVGGMTLCSYEADSARNAAIDLLLSGQVKPSHVAPYLRATLFATAWMRCSYATHPHRHQIKPLLNQALVQYGGLAAIPPLGETERLAALRHRVNGKPVMVIPVEQAWMQHGAMARVYGDIVLAMRERFHTVGFGNSQVLLPWTRTLFDECAAPVADGPHAESVLATVLALRQLKPSIIYYPSVGMVPLCIALANTRIAPVQVMSLGHPASSQSPEMDYVLQEQDLSGNESCYSEQLLLLPAGAFRFEAPPVATAHVGQQPLPGDPVRIAIPAVSQKLSWPLLKTLQEVSARVRRPVEFHFLTGTSGEQYLEAAGQVRRVLPRAVLHPSLAYPDYLAMIARCQLHVASFPFGGTNSLIDSMRLGVPVVALRGPEPHESVDAAFLARIGLAGQLAVDSTEELAALIARLVDDADLRVRLGAATREAVERGVLVGSGHPEWFVDALARLAEEAS
jgi:hypothetical protein